MTCKGKTTTDHGEIRRWAEVRGGLPMVVDGTGEGGGVLRLAFPGAVDTDGLAPISWDEWFQHFDAHALALLIEELTSDGQQSQFNKLVRR